MVTMIVGVVANFVAYVYALADLVTPFGAMSIIISAILAHFLLKERLSLLGVMGCVCCIVGSVVIVLHAPQEESPSFVLEVWALATDLATLRTLKCARLLGNLLFDSLLLLLNLGFTNFLDTVQVVNIKAIDIAIKLTLEALDTFNATIVSPTYYVMFTTLTIAANTIMFKAPSYYTQLETLQYTITS
ncbi:hypothetical protein V2J09_011507 [Rumex salicifolius]